MADENTVKKADDGKGKDDLQQRSSFEINDNVSTVDYDPNTGKMTDGDVSFDPGSPETKKPASEADKSEQDDNEKKDAKDEDSSTSEQGKTPAEDDGKSKVSPVVQKRIDKAVKKQREAERRADIAEKDVAYYKGKADGVTGEETVDPANLSDADKLDLELKKEFGDEPVQKDYDDWDGYYKALNGWNLDRSEFRHKKELVALEARLSKPSGEISAEDRYNEGAKKYDDFNAVVKDPTLNLRNVAAACIVELENSADVAYALGSDRELANKIYDMKSSDAVAAIEELSTQLANAGKPAKQKTKSDAPEPIKTVTGSDTTDKSLTDMTSSEYRRARNRKIKAAGGRGLHYG